MSPTVRSTQEDPVPNHPTPRLRRSRPRAPGLRAIAAVAAAVTLALITSSAVAQAPAPVRVSADDAVGFGVAMSSTLFDDAGAEGTTALHAVLGRDDDFADSLAAGPLLGGGPLLYVPGGESGTLPDAVAAELRRVLPPGSIVYLAGGTAAVSTAIEEAVEALDLLPIRLAGDERTATAAAIAAEVERLHGQVDVILLALATSWPDAIAGAALAASEGHAILLTEAGSLAEASAAFIADRPDADVWVLGGDAVITEATATAAGADRRLSGPTRVDTAAAILAAFPDDVRGTSLAQGYADDGWVEGNAGAAALHPLLLAGPSPDELPATVTDALAGRDGDLVVLGGPDRLSDAAVAQAEAAR
jgi:hypothetical protein